MLGFANEIELQACACHRNDGLHRNMRALARYGCLVGRSGLLVRKAILSLSLLKSRTSFFLVISRRYVRLKRPQAPARLHPTVLFFGPLTR